LNNKKNLLVTTAIEETWGNGEDEKIIFLGGWCKEYSAKSSWDGRKNAVVDFYCRDRNKFEIDHDYLEQFYERLLASLTITLNHYHNVDYSIRYWRIVLGPWLLTYVPAVWNRWESLRIAFEEYEFDETILLNPDIEYEAPSSHQNAMNQIANSHLWNHMLYARILKVFYSKKIRFVNKVYDRTDYSQESVHNARKNTLKYTAASWIDRLLRLIQNNHKIALVTSYFDPRSLVKISLKIGQIPRLYTEFDKVIKMPKILSSSRKLTLDLMCQSQFENFVRDNVLLDAPVTYIEGYRVIRSNALHLLPNCKVIFDANSYWYNELFKTWCAEKVNLGGVLIVSAHGSSMQIKYQSFSHESKISDIYVVWRKALKKNQIQLPPNKMVNRSKGKSNGAHLTIIGVEFPLYGARYCSGTISTLTLDDYHQKLEFINMLNSNIREHVKIRQLKDGNWKIQQRYADKLGEEISSSSHNLLEAFNDSKIIVCTYPETTFFEAIYSKIPTILLYKKEYWELHPEFDDLVKKMKSANIIFSDPVSASSHINRIWNDPRLWWDSPTVIDVRKEFFDQCGRVDDNWLDQWSDFFKEQLIN
jgi:putative transferase (TIGR04331 family)